MKRRRFIKAGMVIPLLSQLPWKSTFASQVDESYMQVPRKIQEQLLLLYGDQANMILHTRRIVLKAPDIAENGANLPLTIKGEKGLVKSMVVFVEENIQPLANMCKLFPGADLAVSFRCKMRKTSDVYVIAQTYEGMVGVKKNIKLTIGCGGG